MPIVVFMLKSGSYSIEYISLNVDDIKLPGNNINYITIYKIDTESFWLQINNLGTQIIRVKSSKSLTISMKQYR